MWQARCSLYTGGPWESLFSDRSLRPNVPRPGAALPLMNSANRKLLHRVLPHKSVRDELRLARRALLRAFRSIRMEWMSKTASLRGQARVKLNIGCGGIIREGWVNLDSYPQPGVFYLDVVNGLPFGVDTVTHIHCEHFLEHLDYDDAARFLTDCQRVLTPAGGMRVIVPDAEKYLTAYCRNDKTFFDQLRGLGNASVPLDTPVKVINQMFRMGGDHKFAWDFQTLSGVAKEAGFSEARKSSLGDVAPELSIDGTDEWRVIESMYVNLVK